MGQTLGLFAYGNGSLHGATRQGIWLHVIAYDPYVSELTISQDGVEPVSLDELLARSDFVSVHAPHNEETDHAFSTDAFAKMKNNAVIINTARGPIIDEAALLDALQSGAIAGAGLDVLEQEPPVARIRYCT